MLRDDSTTVLAIVCQEIGRAPDRYLFIVNPVIRAMNRTGVRRQCLPVCYSVLHRFAGTAGQEPRDLTRLPMCEGRQGGPRGV
jgi:hypothetical protein